MNKLIAILALGLIVGGFLLVTFSYASPTSPSGTNGLPNIDDITHGTGTRPDPPNDSVPSDAKTDTPPADTTTPDTTPPADDTTPPPALPPSEETYVTKYFLSNYVLNTTYNAAKSRYEGRKDVTVAYPVAHVHYTHVLITLSNGMQMTIYRNGAIDHTLAGPLNQYHVWLAPYSTSIETTTRGFFIYGSNAQGTATITLYVTEWPSSKLSLFGTQTNDMTIGVVMLIAGFAALLLFGKR
jgi:hypothetical protein